MSEPIDLDAIKARREACLRADGTANLNYNFVHYDGRALVAEVERLRAQVGRCEHCGAIDECACEVRGG